MATYLVTGGAGFIGSHLTEALMANGHGVKVLDDLSTGKPENVAEGAELIRGDVADAAAVAAAMEGVDGCFHLAAVASVQASVDDWLGTHRANLTGTIAVLDAARRAKGGAAVPVVYASSAAIYGDNPNVPLKETEGAAPLSAYAADKYGSELHAKVAGVIHSVPTFGLRFFNVYGPRQDPSSPYSGVISIFARRMADGKGVTVFGDGEQTRDFIYVGDVVRALRAAQDNASVAAPVSNVCTGAPTSVLALAETLAAASGAELAVDFAPARPGDIRASLGDPAFMQDALGLKAETGLSAGLSHTVAWMKSA